MNVFVVGSPFETAQYLDKRRLNKQIIECRQILAAINGLTDAWAHHPAVLQYQNYKDWLIVYLKCLVYYQSGNIESAKKMSEACDFIRPEWHTEEYLTQMKRRLYTKNKSHYSQWSGLGKSDINMYFVEGKWRYYCNGKQLKNKGED